MANIDIEIDYESVFLPCYHHLLNDGKKFNSKFFDIDFLYGGRDSGKSRFVATIALITCMITPYFKCLLIRKVHNTVRSSQFDLIKSIIENWGLKQLFTINETRMEIIFNANGNGFYGRGLDDVGKIKSFNNPSHSWIEEGNQITAAELVVILTSLRAQQRVKTWFTFNPECEVSYTEFWLYQEWFGHSESLSWEWVKAVEVTYDTFINFPERCYKKDGCYYVDQHIRATHTTYHNNPYCAPERIALYESYKTSKNNAYWYQTYTLGLWGYRRTGGEFWKCFDPVCNTKDLEWLPKMPVHVVVDNNVDPYISLQLWQIDMDKKQLRQFNELPCIHPNNTAAKAARELSRYLDSIGYGATIYLYGDPSANARSTNDDDGRGFFDKFKGQLQGDGWGINDRVKSSAPAVRMSGDFINDIYEHNFEGWHIEIGKQCRKSIEDYTMCQEDANGGVLKKKITNPETKKTYEKYGHMTDCKRYFVTTVLDQEFIKFQNRRKKYIVL
jgi:phage terminase large subunit